METYLIFEGGGAKGLAHAGAYKVACQVAGKQGLEFKGVAGTSAGAIIAALIAVGYTPDELYGKRGGILEKDFTELLDEGTWAKFKQMRSDYKSAFGSRQEFRLTPSTVYEAYKFYRQHRGTLASLLHNRGLSSTKRFADWLEYLLITKLEERGKQISGFGAYRVLFKDIQMPLKIIASDVTSKGMEIFRQGRFDQLSVTEAVCASVSLPFVFMPRNIGGQELTDGGMISNFPVWVFEKEVRHLQDSQYAILGFSLYEKPVSSKPSDGATNPRTSERVEVSPNASILNYTGRLLSTVLSGAKQVGMQNIENLYTIPIGVSVGTTDFELSKPQKDALFNEGVDGANQFFLSYPKIFASPPVQNMKDVLRSVHALMINTLCRVDADLPPDMHLRVNVMMPVSRDHLRVLYTWNMDTIEDTDDRLELSAGSGGAGRCWQEKKPVVVNMQQARQGFFASAQRGTSDEWVMTKYQTALVRQKLQALMCVPILKSGLNPPEIMGVLNFDSDLNLMLNFGRSEVERMALDAANMVARTLLEYPDLGVGGRNNS